MVGSDDMEMPQGPASVHGTRTWSGDVATPRNQAAAVTPLFPDHEILSLLGFGGMGAVYRARDLQRNTIVALKTLLRYSAADLYGFKKEFRALADLNHPNLVSLYQLLSTGEQWCFTMELVEGKSFLADLRDNISEDVPTTFDGMSADTTVPAGLEPLRPAPHIDVTRLRFLLRQLAEGLCFLHAHGKLHCDLKPSNVMVDANGRVVILDFGLARESAGEPVVQATVTRVPGEPAVDLQHTQDQMWTHAGVISGTVVYMSPEQAGGQPLSPATDWYAFGVILFEALTGRLPFDGGAAVLERKQMEDAPAPSELVRGLPPDLERLCVALLQRAPELRPDGAAVLRALGGSSQPAASLRASTAGTLPFVGRMAQQDQLRRAWRVVRAGQAHLILLQGASGSGKSTLAQRFLGELVDADSAVVLRGRCFEQESVPFKAVDALMDHLSHTLKLMTPDEVDEVLPPGTVALATMFPVLRRVSSVEDALDREGTVPDAQEVRRQAFAALRELLARLARRRPLALWVDDLQWGDLDSAELLAALLLDPAPALFVLSFRGEYRTTSICLRTLFALLDKTTGIQRQEVPVEPLTEAEAVLLARQLLGPDLIGAQAARIARESGGNPYFVQELARHARTGASTATQQALSAVELDDVIWERVVQLPEPARVFMEVLAIAGQPLQQSSAWQAAQLQGDDLRHLGLLRTDNLIRGSGPRPEDEVETFHDRIRESIRAHLTPEVARLHHEQLGVALEGVPGTAPERLATHFAGAGQRHRAGTYFARAGEAAAAALAFDLAAAHFRQALEQGAADPAAARGLWRQLGDALANAGRGTEAAEAYLKAADGTGRRDSLLLRGQAGSQLLFAGRTDEGLTVLREVLKSVGMKPYASVLATVLSLRWNQIKLRLRGLRFRERAEKDLSDDERARFDISWPAALGLSIVDPVRGYDLQARNVLVALRLGEPGRISCSLSMFAAHMSAEGSGTWNRVQYLLDVAEKLADRSAQPYARAIVRHDRGVSSFDFARFRESVEFMDQADAAYQKDCKGVYWEMDTVRTFALWSLGYLGNLVEMRRRQATLVKQARERNARYALTNFTTYTTLFAPLAAENPEEAREQLEEARRGWTPRGYYIQTHTMHFGQILLDFYLGRPQAVLDLLKREWFSYRTSVLMQIQIIRTFLLNSRGHAALAAGPAGAGLSASGRDAARLRKEGTVWAASLGQLLEAAVTLRRGQRDVAVPWLERAVAGFDSLGTCLYAAAARRRLGELVGGDRGRELLRQAAETMDGQQVRNHEKMTALITPGFPS